MPEIIKQQWRRLASLDATRGAAILLMIPLHSVLVALLIAAGQATLVPQQQVAMGKPVRLILTFTIQSIANPTYDGVP